MIAVFFLKYFSVVCVCASLCFHMRRYQEGFYLLTLKYTKEFAWELLAADKHKEDPQCSAIQILNSSVLSSFMIVLHVQMQNSSRSLLIFRDAVPDETYRQLKVSLKINGIQPDN